MPTVRRSAHVPYSAAQMFALVNDVERYPEFLHWCHSARVERETEGAIEAALDIGIGGIHKTFRTRNRLKEPGEERPGQIAIELIEGPFRHLEGDWTFRDSTAGGSEVTLDLDYEIRSSPLSMVFAAVFDEVARSQVGAFIKRAAALYGSS